MKNSIAGRLWKVMMGLLLMGVGSIFVQYLWNSHQRAAKMDAWVEVPCVITAREVDDSEFNQRGMTKYVMDVRYEYEFEGKSYEGTRIKKLPTEASDPRKLKKPIAAYPEGTKTVCYVDPASPDQAVLKRDTKAALYSIWFPCLFVVGGAGMALSALFRK